MSGLFRRFGLGASLAALSVATPALAAQSSAAREVDISIPSGPMGASLFKLAQQTGVQIMFTSQMVAGRQAPALSGRMTAEEALNRLVAGSGLEVRRAGVKVLILSGRDGRVLPAATAPLDAASADPAAAPVPPAEAPTELSEIVVGSHIRGVKDGPSPVVVLDRAQLDREGRATVAEALAALPQNFGGTATEQTLRTGADPLGTNASEASGVNLRGLGADATLVLVNGRRLAGTGLRGDFADVSSIPMSAVARIEVLLDGASALYGSDAVGGVVNIVLRDRFDGAETRIMGAAPTRGGATQFQFGHSFGKSWDSGHAMASYEHSLRDRLAGRDRRVAGDADLRSLGGSDHRRYYASPGNILRGGVPAYAIAAGQDGAALTPASFLAGQVNLENFLASYDLMSRQRRDALYLSFAQDVTPSIEFSGEARASRRQFNGRGSAQYASIVVTPANPYYVSPTGAGTETIAYSFQRELGGSRDVGTADTLGFSLGGQARLPRGWRLDAYGAYGVELLDLMSSGLLHSGRLNEATGRVADDPATSFRTSADGYFNPFIGQGANARPILDFVTSGWSRRKTRGETRSLNLKLDGTIIELPAGPLALAVGVQTRTEGLRSGGETFTSGTRASPNAYKDMSRSVNAAFAEVRAPIFGAANRRAGLERLELSAAVRREDYGGEVKSTDPKVGLIWSPVAGATVKASYGTSFRAPALTEMNDPAIFAPTILPNGPASVISMLMYGGNKDLKPETAKSAAVTLDLAPAAWGGLKTSLTVYETRFENRIGQPGRENLLTVLSAPEFAPFRAFVSPAANSADYALIQSMIDAPNSYAQGVFPTAAYGAIVDARWVNTGEVLVRGVDVAGQYATRIGEDPLVFSGSASWLVDYKRKVTPTSRAVDLAGQVGSPADLRLRASAAWTHRALTTTLSLNHVGDLRDTAGKRVAPWTTADLNLTYAAQGGRLAGLTVGLNLANLTDEDPPFYDSALGIGYDATNANPIGRVVSLQLTKAW
ncbi:TonB-dependent receptor [Caulobacter sp. 602-2]|uniref:TonB-dependent receptor n=1 Tax=Caulobacter sp. 602-2 TaxID=2710887 RepID=A0A6G4QUP6_9CAUL|nr:TonB-dependent receptor [Caulobacter sp. 602-2]NGM49376.1 TonB-dependent receptor [Caulobacter sp. 602-2]